MIDVTSILPYICESSDKAPFLIFGLFIASGFFLPISEELLFLLAGVLAGTCMDHTKPKMYVAALSGSVIAAWQVFFIGRLCRNRWQNIPLLTYILRQKHLDQLRVWTEKWGVSLFFIVRFCPGGIRNAFFLSSGINRIPFSYFAPRDFAAAVVACTCFFSLGVFFSERGSELIDFVAKEEKRISLIILAVLGVFLIGILLKKRWEMR